ncbi:conserved hypothetical protein [Methanolacinia petrolearia DSM 11571]|uniref:Uncharacterized protein n=1 Tax=Methanolacinia petrolearia (strain DSM 11571 / OCM 486 / SEBR 4847) TaxID=679926 RepID=E1RD65_METP4|nr:conserved hypothetical protein [Methanolacinia petrolearia DSM 11571]
MIDILQTPAMLAGLAGGVLTVSQRRKYRKAGYCSWIFGNTLWTISGFFTGNVNLIVQFAFFAVLALKGVRLNAGDDQNSN